MHAVPFLSRARLLPALLLAAPASLLVLGAFEPIAINRTLEGPAATATFELAAAEPLFIETEFAVRPPDGAPAGPLALVLDVNGSPVARLAPDRPFVVTRAMPLSPAASQRAGGNRLTLAAEGPPGTTLAATLRIHNYFGLNPRVPRAYVVADEAAWRQVRSPWQLLRLAGLLGASLALVAGLGLLARRETPGRRAVLLASPSALLWAVLAYSLATPLHVWLAPDGLLAVVLASLLLGAAALWVHTRRRRVLQAAALALLTLAIGEGGLRALNALRPVPVFYSDAYTRFRPAPGSPFLETRLNDRGFNDVDRAAARPDGVRYRVVALGDSVAFGVVPRADNHLALAGAALAARGVEVLNLGIPGIAPGDYLSVLLNEGLAYGPDLVVTEVFVGNDFEPVVRAPYERSYLATALYFLWRVATAGAPADAVVGTSAVYDDEAPTFSRDRFLEIEVERAWVYADPPRLDAAVEAVLADLTAMRDAAARGGADFLVVIVPDEAQVDPALGAVVQAAYGADLDYQRPNRALGAALEAGGIDVLDLLPPFAAAGAGTRLYKPQDTHWNLAGNRLAADLLVEALAARLPRE